ncbi:increased DNA methylation 1-like [Bidens hawaiensis]|uniref:increased DNA methylation 1-like n=1 Tax=Bidens hawaiensis TaxID=980011 RepID=UPI00404B2F85
MWDLQVFMGLQRLLGKSIPVGKDNLTWTLRKNKTFQLSNLDTPDTGELIENFGKLNVAISVMHECFEPVKERRTGGDVVEDVIFCRRSELRRLNFKGFYTVLLEKDDELISTAVVRVYGEKVAEIPLVGTRFQYRRRGMCHILMQELERKLKELKVERLVLPAVSSVRQTWTRSFGFSAMTESDKFKLLDFTFLDFQGTTMCHRLLIKPSISKGSSCRNVVDLDRVTDVLEESRASGEGVNGGVEPDFFKCYRRRNFAPLNVEAVYQKWMC